MSYRPQFDDGLVRRLIDDQFPDWSSLPLERVEPAGSDHAIYRLGADLSVRIPRHSGAADQAVKDAYWLPKLAPKLPMIIPEPVAVGEPDLGYPWPWSICRWLSGRTATVEEFGDSLGTTQDLADFLISLRDFAGDVPTDWRDRLTRSPLTGRDNVTRQAIGQVAEDFDAAAMTTVWEDALAAAPGAPQWVHGDFHTGNLLAEDGRVTTVLDFGSFGIGDDAVDLMIAFTLMSSRCRNRFRELLDPDGGTWARGRGWALSTGLTAYTAYASSSPHIAAQTTRQINAALRG